LIAFSASLAGGIYVPTLWAKFLLLAVTTLAGLMMSVDLLTRILSALVDRQRWKFKQRNETGNTIVVPNTAIQGESVKRLFAHPDVSLKSADGLRQLIRWWHAPSADCHQELMERNELYLELRPITSRLLSAPVADVRQLARTYVEEAMLRQLDHGSVWSVTRLRTVVGPIVMAFCYEFILGRKCPPEALSLLMASTTDVIAATRSLSRRNLPKRADALAHLTSVLEAEGGRPDIFGDNCTLSVEQRARYLQGVWMHTAVGQIMRLISNAICHLSRNPRCMENVKREVGQAGSYVDAVILETLRLTPGISTTNRVASQNIALSKGVNIEGGTNILFDIGRYHRIGFDRPDEFIPERWDDDKKKEANFMPFGMGKTRCPAERFAQVAAKEMLLGIVASLEIHFPARRGLLFTTRPEISTDLCCVIRRPPISPLRLWGVRCLLNGFFTVENVRRSVMQLAIMPKNAEDAFRVPTL